MALALLASPLGPLHGSAAHADGAADEAQLHFEIAAEHYRTGDFRGALEHFLLSNRLVANRNVVFNIARTYEQLRRFADAHRYYIDALNSDPTEQTRQEITAAIARIAPNVAVLRVETTPPGATIFLDRRDLGSRGTTPRPLAVPEGRYRVIAVLEGYEPAEQDGVVTHLGQETPVQLQLTRIVGTVHVDAPATAAVQVRVGAEDAPAQCVAPCDVRLPPGPHAVYLTREGYQPLLRPVTVVARATVNLRETLVPLTGSLAVGADENNARIEVDGRTVGYTPAVVQSIAVGHRRVRVSLAGFTAVEREIDVRPNEQTELQDIRLTPLREVTAASRVTENIDDAPSSVTVISQQELAAFAYPTIGESLRGIRGITLTNDSAYQSASIRGLGQPDDYGNRLLVLSDGLVMNDNILYSSYIGYDGRTDLHDVERIEIVRGPGSVLYGTGAMSGVVNLVTRQQRDAPTSVHAGFSTYDNAVARGRAGFHLNLGRDSGLWVSVAGARSEGRDVTLQIPDGMGNTTPTLVHQVDSFWSNMIAARAWTGPLTAQFFFNTRDQAVPAGVYGVAIGDLRSHLQDTRTAFEVRYEPRFSPQVQLMTRVYGNAYDYHANQAYAGVTDPPNEENYHGLWFGGEVRGIWTPASNTRISLGVEEQYNARAYLEGQDGPINAVATDPMLRRHYYLNTDCRIDSSCTMQMRDPITYNVLAFYGVAESSITSWLRVSGGLRVDVNSLFGAFPSPRLALIFRPTANGVLKVMGGRAFRAPSVYEIYYNDGGQTTNPSNRAEGQQLQPEVSNTAEVEYTHHFSADWTGIASVHGTYYTSLITTTGAGTTTDPLQYTNSHDDAFTAGADVEVRRDFRQGWMLSAMYGYLFARFLPAANPAMTPINTQLPNSPEHFASFRAVAPLIRGELSAAARVTLEAPRRISTDTDETTPPAVISDVVVSGNVPRFGLRYSVGVYNLFDWHYVVPVSTTFASPTMPQLGRSFMLNVIVGI